jgi:hypothetical protein
MSGGSAKSFDKSGMNSELTSLSNNEYLTCSKIEGQLEGNAFVAEHAVDQKVSSKTTLNWGEVSLDLGV